MLMGQQKDAGGVGPADALLSLSWDGGASLPAAGAGGVVCPGLLDMMWMMHIPSLLPPPKPPQRTVYQSEASTVLLPCPQSQHEAPQVCFCTLLCLPLVLMCLVTLLLVFVVLPWLRYDAVTISLHATCALPHNGSL